MQKKVTLKTRPFQPFLLGANDLMALARPYYDQIQANKTQYEKTNEIELLPQGVWHMEKSLSVGSFLLKYAGLEAFVNCAHEDFGRRSFESLPTGHFEWLPPRARKNLTNRSFADWPLRNRVLFLVTLCSKDLVEARTVFDIGSMDWARFEETIRIRHSFAHAASVRVEHKITKAGPKLWIASDEHESNFWPATKAARRHGIFNYETATMLNAVIDWVITGLREALPSFLDVDYMTKEQAIERDNRGNILATFNFGHLDEPPSG